MAREIPLTQGLVTVVDDDDFAWLSKWKWLANRSKRNVYACRNTGGRQNPVRVHMHRLIIGAAAAEIVDHVDGDGLNNRRENLRIVTARQNCWNITRTSAKSGEIGVYPARHGWMASLTINGERKYLGYYQERADAVRARRAAELEYFGEFARKLPT